MMHESTLIKQKSASNNQQRPKLRDLGISQQDNLKIKLFNVLSSAHFLHPPIKFQFQAFCLGLPRSGTHSLAHLFQSNYAAQHEPLKQLTVANILDWTQGKHNDSKMRSILASRNKHLKLEFESSHFLHSAVEILVDLFPEAKFILTVREPVSWLASEINQNYTSRNSSFWVTLQQHRYQNYGNKYTYDALVNIPSVYPISNYLAYWQAHITHVLNHVPKDRLLILDTFEIKSQLGEIASFVGADLEHLDLTQSWSGKRKPSLELYDLVDKSQVLLQISESCRDFIDTKIPLMSKYLL